MDSVKNKGHTRIPHVLLVVTGPASALYSQESTRGENTGSTKIAEHSKARSYPTEHDGCWHCREQGVRSATRNSPPALPFCESECSEPKPVPPLQQGNRTRRCAWKCKPGSRPLQNSSACLVPRWPEGVTVGQAKAVNRNQEAGMIRQLLFPAPTPHFQRQF